MALIMEAIDAGVFHPSESTRRFFADYSTALFERDFTPMEDRPGAAEAIAEMRSLFDEDYSCDDFKNRLYELGVLGCGRSRRMKAIAAALGLTDKQVEDCLSEPKATGDEPHVYYLPPEDAPITKVGGEDVPDTKEPASYCPSPEAPGPDSHLCPTDSGRGCEEPDGEDTADLENPSDCQTAEDILRGISDLFPTLPGGALSDRTDQEGNIIEASSRGEQAKQDAQTVLKETGNTIAGSFADYWATSPLDTILADIKAGPPVRAQITSDDVVSHYANPEDAALDENETDQDRAESDPYDTLSVENSLDEIKAIMQGFGTSINQLDDLAQIIDLAGDGIQAAAILGHLDMIEEFKNIIRQAEDAQRPLEEAEIAARRIDNHWDEEPNVVEVQPSITQAFPLYSPRTYLDALYTAINIHDIPAMKNCQNVQDASEQLIETINNTIDSLPVGYINPDLLPPRGDTPDFTVKQPPRFSPAGLSPAAGMAARRSAASNRRYRANQMEA